MSYRSEQRGTRNVGSSEAPSITATWHCTRFQQSTRNRRHTRLPLLLRSFITFCALLLSNQYRILCSSHIPTLSTIFLDFVVMQNCSILPIRGSRSMLAHRCSGLASRKFPGIASLDYDTSQHAHVVL